MHANSCQPDFRELHPERRWSVSQGVKSAQDLMRSGAGAVVGMDVDPSNSVAGIEDDGGGHRQGGGAVGVDAGQVESELQLGGTALIGWLGEDAEAAGEGVSR